MIGGWLQLPRPQQHISAHLLFHTTLHSTGTNSTCLWTQTSPSPVTGKSRGTCWQQCPLVINMKQNSFYKWRRAGWIWRTTSERLYGNVCIPSLWSPAMDGLRQSKLPRLPEPPQERCFFHQGSSQSSKGLCQAATGTTEDNNNISLNNNNRLQHQLQQPKEVEVTGDVRLKSSIKLSYLTLLV